MDGERIVAGLHCGEVLAELTAYLERSLPAERLRQIEEHGRGCEACLRFTGTMRETVAALRDRLGAAVSDDEVEARLLARLALELADPLP
jgi:anti-sigma factor RsiW